MNNEQKNIIQNKWKEYRKKYVVARSWFIAINVFVLVASALLILLNLFTLKYNKVPELQDLKGIFIALAIVTGLGTCFIAISSAFQFKEKKIKYANNIKTISELTENKEPMTNEEFLVLLAEIEERLIE